MTADILSPQDTRALFSGYSWVVRTRRVLARDVVLLELADRSGRQLPAWEPGAHVELEVAIDGAPQIRRYSLCGDPEDLTHYRIAVLREPEGRGGSLAVHDTLNEDVEVRVLGLRNHFAWEPAAAAAVVFVAGGIGITPFLPMIAAAARAGRPWSLHYSGRNPGGMAFREELTARHPESVAFYGQGDGRRLDASALLTPAAAGTVVYTCGPAALMSAIAEVGSGLGLEVRRELFNGEGAGPVAASDGTFEVHFARADVTIQVGPGESILELGEAAGVDIFGSCYEGICGTCETRVLSGTPDHRDAVLDGSPTDTMMICVSRAACPRLVLDA